MTNRQSERTYGWGNPELRAELAAGKTGTEFVELLTTHRPFLSPYWETLGLQNFEVLAEGKTRLTIQPREFHYNTLGGVHGGFIASLLDTATGTAVHSTLPKAGALTTMTLSSYFVRSITTETGIMYCYGEVIRVGRRTATSEARLVDAEDKLYAHGTATLMLFLD